VSVASDRLRLLSLNTNDTPSSSYHPTVNGQKEAYKRPLMLLGSISSPQASSLPHKTSRDMKSKNTLSNSLELSTILLLLSGFMGFQQYCFRWNCFGFVRVGCGMVCT